MGELFPEFIPLQEQILEAQREVNLRRRVYPKMVEDGRVKADRAQRWIAIMEAIVTTLRAQVPIEWTGPGGVKPIEKLTHEELLRAFRIVCLDWEREMEPQAVHERALRRLGQLKES